MAWIVKMAKIDKIGPKTNGIMPHSKIRIEWKRENLKVCRNTLIRHSVGGCVLSAAG